MQPLAEKYPYFQKILDELQFSAAQAAIYRIIPASSCLQPLPTLHHANDVLAPAVAVKQGALDFSCVLPLLFCAGSRPLS